MILIQFLNSLSFELFYIIGVLKIKVVQTCDLKIRILAVMWINIILQLKKYFNNTLNL